MAFVTKPQGFSEGHLEECWWESVQGLECLLPALNVTVTAWLPLMTLWALPFSATILLVLLGTARQVSDFDVIPFYARVTLPGHAFIVSSCLQDL